MNRRDPQADGPTRVVCWNPATGQRVASIPAASPDQVKTAMLAARRAQNDWAKLSVKVRCQTFKEIRVRFIEAMPRLVRVLLQETGKPEAAAIWSELIQTGHWLGWYSRHAPRALKPERRRPELLPNRRLEIEYVARGVVAVISPWNYPMAVPAGSIIPSLLAGNAVLLKPSEITPLSALALRQIFVDGGLPPDLFQVLIGHSETAKALIAQAPDHIVFTGSVATGRSVAQAAGQGLTESILELGGKAAAIVLPDAEIDRSARAIAWGGLFNSGHTCVAVDRVFAVGNHTYENLVDSLKSRISELRTGPPSSDNELGPLINERQAETAERLIRDALAKGARLLSGGERTDKTSPYLEPTLLADCNQDMAVMHEESFAPIIPVQLVPDEETAVQLTNVSELGLNAYVFGSTSRARQLASRLEVGMVAVNNTLDHFALPEHPWGGIKLSGYGRTHGYNALRTACTQRVVSWSQFSLLASEPWWFPYSQKAINSAWKLGRCVADGRLLSRLAWLFQQPPEVPDLTEAMPPLPDGSTLDQTSLTDRPAVGK